MAEYRRPTFGEWSRLIGDSPDASVLKHPAYYRTQKRLGDRVLSLCCFVRGRPKSLVAGYLRLRGRHRGILTVGSRSGGYPVRVAGFRDPKAEEELIARFDALACATPGVRQIRFYTRFYEPFPLMSGIGYAPQADETTLLEISCHPDKIFARMDKRCRTAIKSAERKGVSSGVDNSPKAFGTFYRMYSETMKRVGAERLSRAYLGTRFREYVRNGLGDMWFARAEGKAVACAFIGRHGSTVHYLYGASSKAGWAYSPNNKLQWDIIRHYHGLGYRTYNMWGVRPLATIGTCDTGPRPYGRFKLSFGGHLVPIVRHVKRL